MDHIKLVLWFVFVPVPFSVPTALRFLSKPRQNKLISMIHEHTGPFQMEVSTREAAHCPARYVNALADVVHFHCADLPRYSGDPLQHKNRLHELPDKTWCTRNFQT